MSKLVRGRSMVKMVGMLSVVAALVGIMLTVPVTETNAANIVVNGGFEDPQISGWSVYSSIPGWNATIGGIEIQNHAAGSPYEGSQHVELDAYYNSTMIQTVNTTAGQSYNLSFAYSPRPYVGKGSNGIDVFFGSTPVASLAADGGSVTSWIVYNYTVTATESLTDLQFVATGVSDSYGGYIDAVSLNAVPVPPALWLLGSGLVGLVGIRRKIGN